MKRTSILNDVIGPVMRGPSSSHTAGSWHLATLARALLDDVPVEASFTFDPGGSYAPCLQPQSADRAFVAGLLGWPITDDRFPDALTTAPGHGLAVHFGVEPLAGADHPNTVRIHLRGRGGRTLRLIGRSVGGGAVELDSLDGWPVNLRGYGHETLADGPLGRERHIAAVLEADGGLLDPIQRLERGDRVLVWGRRRAPLPAEAVARLARPGGDIRLYPGVPLGFIRCGPQWFNSAADLARVAVEAGLSLGRAALRYEATLLDLGEDEVLAEALRRVDIMLAAVRAGLVDDGPGMQLLRPTAGTILRADTEGRLAAGGLHSRAAIRALAAMHVNCARGVVCAAPTAGSAGVLPGVLATLAEESGVDRPGLGRALLAAGAVGVVVAERSTFAAEVAGCQVEIGAAGAMAAAAVVEAAGGSPGQACDAAAISFQNTMGSVCDLVQGIVEIPCHTRNAAAAAAAFVNADLILGGYHNPIPLDETIDAVHAVGLSMPVELRVTSLGGLAATPSARAMPRLDTPAGRNS